MEHLIRELEVEVLRTEYPYNELTDDYFMNYWSYYKTLPTLSSVIKLVDLKNKFKHKSNIFFIDSYSYEAAVAESGAIRCFTGVCKESVNRGLNFQEILNLKDHDKTNVVIGFVTDDSIHYDILSKSYKTIIAVDTLRQ